MSSKLSKFRRQGGFACHVALLVSIPTTPRPHANHNFKSGIPLSIQTPQRNATHSCGLRTPAQAFSKVDLLTQAASQMEDFLLEVWTPGL